MMASIPPNHSYDIWTLLTQLIAGGGLVALIKAISSLVSTYREKAPSLVFKNMAQIYDELASLKQVLKCDRIHIVYTSNGGGIPSPGVPIYSSVLYEAASDTLQPVKEKFQRLLLDQSYSKMMENLVVSGIWAAKINEMERGFFKDACQANGIVYVCKQKIKVTKDKFYFISCFWTDPNDVPKTALLQSEMYLSCNKLRGLLK